MSKSFPIKIYWFLVLFVFVGLQFDDGFALAQPILKDSYQGIGQVPAKNENYVEARRKAVIYAMKNAMEKVFKDLMDEEKFATNQSGKNCFLIMTLVEGKNRHIKKVCEHINHPVIKLQRTHFGGLNLTGLPLGACRFLSTKEVKSLKKLVIDDPPANRLAKKKR